MFGWGGPRSRRGEGRCRAAPGQREGHRPTKGPTEGGKGRGLGPQLGGGGGSLPETRALPPVRRAEGLEAEESVTPSPGRPCPRSDQARGPSLPDSCLWGWVTAPPPAPATRPGDYR